MIFQRLKKTAYYSKIYIIYCDDRHCSLISYIKQDIFFAKTKYPLIATPKAF